MSLNARYWHEERVDRWPWRCSSGAPFGPGNCPARENCPDLPVSPRGARRTSQTCGRECRARHAVRSHRGVRVWIAGAPNRARRLLLRRIWLQHAARAASSRRVAAGHFSNAAELDPFGKVSLCVRTDELDRRDQLTSFLVGAQHVAIGVEAIGTDRRRPTSRRFLSKRQAVRRPTCSATRVKGCRRERLRRPWPMAARQAARCPASTTSTRVSQGIAVRAS